MTRLMMGFGPLPGRPVGRGDHDFDAIYAGVLTHI